MWPHWLGRGGDSDEEGGHHNQPGGRKSHGAETWGVRDRFLGQSRVQSANCQVLAARSSVVTVVVVVVVPAGHSLHWAVVSSCTVRSYQDQLTPVKTGLVRVAEVC